jgi:hypothetical protein
MYTSNESVVIEAASYSEQPTRQEQHDSREKGSIMFGRSAPFFKMALRGWSTVQQRCHLGRSGVDLAPFTAIMAPTASHKHSVFVFHGLGDSHQGYQDLISHWSHQFSSMYSSTPAI